MKQEDDCFVLFSDDRFFFFCQMTNVTITGNNITMLLSKKSCEVSLLKLFLDGSIPTLGCVSDFNETRFLNEIFSCLLFVFHWFVSSQRCQSFIRTFMSSVTQTLTLLLRSE